jgi:predicted nucleic acid-binding protein
MTKLERGEVRVGQYTDGIGKIEIGAPPHEGDLVRIIQYPEQSIVVGVDAIDALCKALQQAKTTNTIRHMKGLAEKARTWIENHGTRKWDTMVADVMTELELSEHDADCVLALVQDHAQVFVEFDMGTMFTVEELAAAE